MSRIEFSRNDYQTRETLPVYKRPGRLVYSSVHAANVPVISAHYDTFDRSWLVSMPGYLTRAEDVGAARADYPTIVYERTGPSSWRETARISGTKLE
jgi:hypothetical protein